MVRRCRRKAVIGGMHGLRIQIERAQAHDGRILRGKVVEERALRDHGTFRDHSDGHVFIAEFVHQRDG